MAVKNVRGDLVLLPWTYESVMKNGLADASEARRKVQSDSIKALSEWFRINFHNLTVADKEWTASVIRLKAGRGLINFRTRGENVATGMLYDLKAIPGVIGVTLVEKDLDSMAFSYRLFYNRQRLQQPLQESVLRISRKYK